jgi:hypothetical protein
MALGIERFPPHPCPQSTVADTVDLELCREQLARFKQKKQFTQPVDQQLFPILRLQLNKDLLTALDIGAGGHDLPQPQSGLPKQGRQAITLRLDPHIGRVLQ